MIRQPRIPRQSIFKGRLPKGFEYSPRTYDPEKERIEELKRRMQNAQDGVYSNADVASRIREGIRHRRSSRGSNWNYLIRLGAILAALIAFINYVLAA
jgi:hypothetical protein